MPNRIDIRFLPLPAVMTNMDVAVHGQPHSRCRVDFFDAITNGWIIVVAFATAATTWRARPPRTAPDQEPPPGQKKPAKSACALRRSGMEGLENAFGQLSRQNRSEEPRQAGMVRPSHVDPTQHPAVLFQPPRREKRSA
jgi:hypothetical protein